MSQKRLFLIDGSAVFYRSYFAFIKNPLINSKGENTSATFGFFNTLIKILIDERPDYISIVFDTGQPTFRHELSPSYKATREKMPDDLRDQLPRIRQMADCLKIPILELNGYEADDIIGTLSVKAEEKGIFSYLVSGDKDFMQLITKNVSMYAVGKSGGAPEISSFEAVQTKFGCSPEKVIDVLGLMGDTSDNVPGVQGIGPKTATKLIQEYGSIEGLYEHIDAMKPSKNKERLIEQKAQALLSKELVTIDLNVPIQYSFESMALETPDMEQTISFMEEIEFQRQIKRVEDYVKTLEIKAPKIDKPHIVHKKTYVQIDSLEAFNQLIQQIKSKPTAFDTETTSVESLNCELVGFSFSNEAHTGYYLPANSEFYQLNREHILSELKSYFENPDHLKIGQNMKYDCLVLSQYDIRVRGLYFDTMIAHYLLNPSGRNHSLDDMAKEHFNYTMQPISDLIGKGKNQLTMDQIDVEKVTFYASEDADLTYQLYNILLPQLKEAELWDLFASIEMPLVETLIQVEKNGVHIDDAFLADYSQTLSDEIEIKLTKIHEICDAAYHQFIPEKLAAFTDDFLKKQPLAENATQDLIISQLELYLDSISILIPKSKTNAFLKDFKNRLKHEQNQDIHGLYQNELNTLNTVLTKHLTEEKFNLNSPKQLGLVLFEAIEIHKDLGKRAPKKTKTGQYSTAESELEKYQGHEVIQYILDYRELTKLKSTYVDALPRLVNPKTGAIHTSFNQTIAATGRLSSTEPNLQNIPIRTELGRHIRKAFIPQHGRILLAADYSQIELRIAAHMSGDRQMQAAFKYGQDIHTSTAALIFNVDMDAVTPDMRRKAKEINFGIIYGISEWGLAPRIHVEPAVARAFIEDYLKQFPGIKNYMMNTIAEARLTEKVKTLNGRIRHIPEINSDNRMVKEGAERIAINTPIQGTAADLIKIAMINIQREMEAKQLQSEMILQVHDELVFEVIETEMDILKELITRHMENAMTLDVNLKTEIGTGLNWLEAH